MRSFDNERWDVPGPRWITQLQLGPAALDLGDVYAASAGRWWKSHGDGRSFEQVFRVLPRDVRHVTLTLVDHPAADVPQARVEQLHCAIADRLAHVGPVEIRLGPAIPNTFAIELYIEPSTALTALQALVVEAYRETFPDAAPEPRHKQWRAHTAIGYCTSDFDDTTLASALLRTPGPVAGYLGSVTSTVTQVLLAATDAWSPSGLTWDRETALPLPLGTPTGSQ